MEKIGLIIKNLQHCDEEAYIELPSPRKYPMSSSYNEMGVFQGNLILQLNEERIPQLLATFDKNEIMSADPFVVVDYGCAGGKNSLPFIETIVNYIHSLNQNKEIEIFLNDLPENDFRIPLNLLDKHFRGRKNVFVYGVGKSFYRQIVAEKKVNLMLAFICLQWINKIICPFKDEFIVTSLHPDETVRKLWEKQAKTDLFLYLELRKQELKKGGIICFTIPISNEVSEDAFQILQFFQKGKIQALKKRGIEAMHEHFVINEYFRSFKACQEVIDKFKEVLQVDQLIDLDFTVWELDELDQEKSIRDGATSYAYSWKTALENSYVDILLSKCKEVCNEEISANEAKKINDEIYEEAITLMLDYYRKQKSIKFKVCFGCLRLK